MQCAVVEFARNVLRLDGAHSSEFNPKTPFPVIDYMNEQKNIKKLGGTMRLGGYKCTLKEDTLAFKCYGKQDIVERHRHRLEFNNKFREDFERAGVTISGVNVERNLVEIIEIKSHRWFLGCQFHPEFKSKPTNPHPLFSSFIAASYKFKRDNEQQEVNG
jgi:CTP synthase (EC 6.3.4.2)